MNASISRHAAPPGSNVILGDSAGGTFNRNFGSTNLFVDPDVLSCGPTPSCTDFAEWNSIRQRYWQTLIPGDPLGSAEAPHHFFNQISRLREGRINIWFATSLSEQLSVAHTVHVLTTLGVAREDVHLIPFEFQAGHAAPVRGMGELNEERMADHPAPVPLTPQLLEDYLAAWAAMTSADPRMFERFAVARPLASEWLKRAMLLMLRRFPDRQSGLTYWDRVLLGYADEQAKKCARLVGHAIGNHWSEGDFVGDVWLFSRLLRMGDEHLRNPLLAITGNRAHMRECEATLTPFGRDVLEGRASSYPTNPIEDWAAGVKLSSATGNLWFNDGGRLVRA